MTTELVTLEELKASAVDNITALALAYRLHPTHQTTREIRKTVTECIVRDIDTAYVLGDIHATRRHTEALKSALTFSLAERLRSLNPFRRNRKEDPDA
jgi:hypothetical protein